MKNRFCDHQQSPIVQLVQNTMHKRPNPTARRGCYSEPKRLHPDDLQRILRPTPTRPRPASQWTPSIHYEFIASYMPKEVADAYITRSEAWFAAQPPAAPRPPPRHENVDREMVAALVAKWGAHVPLSEYARAGYSAEALEKIKARRQWYKDHSDELDAEIERRWPGSKTKPKKVIKAVKKKMH